MAGIWDQYSGVAPNTPADKPWYSDAYEVGRQVGAGAMVDLPRMVGQGMRWVAPDGSSMDDTGREMVEAANVRAEDWTPDMEGRGPVAGTLIKGARAVAPMIPAIAAGFVPGGQAIAPTVAATMFGTSAAQDTEDKLRNQGISDSDATAAGWRTGLVQGPLEGVATMAGAGALRGLRPVFGGAAGSTAGMASRLADDAVLKPLAKGMGLNLLVQPATEVAQDVGTELIERSYGAAPEDAWEIAKDSAQGGLGLTLLLGPFAAGSQIARSQRATQIKQALYDPNTPEPVRAQVRDMVVQAAAKDGVSAQDSDVWLDEQFAADDARMEAEAARDAQYAQDQGQVLFDEQEQRRAAQANQDRADITELMRAPTSPLGVVAQEPTAGMTGAAAIDPIMQAQQVVQAEREQVAIARQAAEAEAQAQKTPQQLAKEQAEAATIVLNQQAAIVAKEEGVAEIKGAAQVIKEMMRASDAITPELSGAIMGELKSGDVASARKLVTEAVKQQKKRQDDAIKEAKGLAESEAAIAQDNAERVANDQAKLTAKAPAPPPAPVPTPQPQTAAAPAVEKTPGQIVVEGIKAKTGLTMTPIAQRRLFILSGMDPDDGRIVSSPRTLDQVAAIEQALSKRKTPVSREAIRKSLAPYGITKEVLDRMGEMVATEQTAAVDTNEDGELVDRAAPEDSTPQTAFDNGLDADVAAMQETGGESATMRVRTNLGTSIVEPEMTAAQRRVELEGNKLLGGTRTAAAQERKRAAVEEATTPVITPEQAARNAEILAQAEVSSALQADIDAINDSVSKVNKLTNLVPLKLHDQIDRAAEDWKESMTGDDAAWDDLSVAQQAQWVRAFDAWDMGDPAMTDRAFSRVYESINDDVRDQRSEAARRAPEPARSEPAASANDSAGTNPPDGGRPSAPAQDGAGGPAAGSDSSGDRTADLGDAALDRTSFALKGVADKAGKDVMVMTQSLADMERNPGIKEVFEKLRKDGLGNVLDAVQQWFITRSKTDFGGAYAQIDGKPSVVMGIQEMLRPANAAWTVSHELGHAVDRVENGGLFSAMPEFNMRIVGNEIRAHGQIMEQVLDHYENKSDKWFFETFQYPLDRKTHGDLGADEVRQEVFAQLWATYNTRSGKEYLEDNLPDVAYFMEKAVENVQQTQYGAEGVASPANAAAPSRARGGQEARPQGRADAQQGPRGDVESVRFNRSQVAAAENRALSPLARETVAASQQFIKDLKSKALLWGSFTEDLANNIKDKLPSVTRYIELQKEAQVAKTRAERDVEAVLDMYAGLPAHERGTGPGSVNAFLKDSTTEKKWGYRPEYVKNVKVDPAMAQRFNGLSKPAQDLIKRVFKHGHDSLEQLKKAVNDNIASEHDAIIAAAAKAGDKKTAQKEMDAKAKALRDFKSLNAMNGDWPYAPLKRFGNHVVVGMSQAYLDAEKAGDNAKMEELQSQGNHYYVAFAETEREARKLKSQIEGDYAYADNFEKDGVTEQMYGGRDVLGAFSRLRKLVENTQDEKLTKASSGALKRLMVDLRLSLLSEQSARQSERQRTGVAGADDDMMRAFATKGRANAHFIASLQNNGRIQDQLDAMEKEADARVPGREERRHAYNEMLRRHVMGLDYNPTPLVDKALSASSAWMLLTSPAYFLTNATQPFVMSLPTLAGKHGYTKSFAAMSKAYSDIMPLLKDGQLTQDDYSRMPADVRPIIEALADRGRIDISLEQDLGNWRSTEDSKLQKLGWAVGKMRNVTQTVESMNRIVTAIAAARLERNAGASPEAQANYAEKVIFDTHGDYSGFNSPRLMRTGIGRLMTQFRKFQLIQISMYAKLLNQAFKGASPEDRLLAKRALAYNLIHMFALGGTLALPGAQAIGYILGAVFGDDDEPKNPEKTLRDMVPEEFADLFSKGIPKALGLDLSGRLGSGNMLSLLPFADTSVSRKGYEAAVMGALGPFLGGMLPKFADGLDMMGKGDYWKGMEQLLPKGFADLSKATRQATGGMTQRNGDTVMQPDEISALATAFQAIGLPTTSLTDRSYRASSKFKADEHFKSRSNEIKRDYSEAYRSGDQAALVSARQDWERMQKARAEYGYKPLPMSDLLKAPMERAKREANTAGGVQFNRTNRQFVESMAE